MPRLGHRICRCFQEVKAYGHVLDSFSLMGQDAGPPKLALDKNKPIPVGPQAIHWATQLPQTPHSKATAHLDPDAAVTGLLSFSPTASSIRRSRAQSLSHKVPPLRTTILLLQPHNSPHSTPRRRSMNPRSVNQRPTAPRHHDLVLLLGSTPHRAATISDTSTSPSTIAISPRCSSDLPVAAQPFQFWFSTRRAPKHQSYPSHLSHARVFASKTTFLF
ncbi:hypothetical protein SLA2020_264620 [Shorea laevis]